MITASALVIGWVAKIQGFGLGFSSLSPSYQNNFWSFLMFFQSSAYTSNYASFTFETKWWNAWFNPSAMPKTQKPEFLIPKQSLGSVQTLPKAMISARFNAQMKFIFCICMKNGILYKQIPWSKLTRICICQEENKV